MPGLDCTDGQMTSGDFAKTLLASSQTPPAFPVSASLDLTSRCNLKCLHCFLRYEGVNPRDKTTREVIQVLDTLRDFGVLFLVLTGGDPFVRPDFKPLYLAAKRNGFFLTLFSNGTLLDEDLMDFLANQPPRRIELTAYGHTEATYEAVTGIPGSFRKFRNTVEGLLRRGLLLRLKSMALRTNVHELEAIREWALALGCDFRYDAIVHPCLDGDAAPLHERLDPATIAQFRRRDRERKSDSSRNTTPPRTPARKHLFECGAGILTAHVDAQHQAHPCMSWRLDPFDMTYNPTLTAWQAHITALRNRPPPGGLCDSCEERERCQSCAAYSVLETGEPGGVPAFFCKLVEEEIKAGV
jgi:MoaA/NifB/PqqE/SkfB family radical SAM enzyme